MNDTIARRNAQNAYDFAVAELARTDDPPIRYGEGNWKALLEQERAWHATAEYAQLREYRSWLYTVKSVADYRRRHPIVRLLQRSQNVGRVEQGEYGEPTSRLHWHWQNLDDDLRTLDHSPSIGMLALPDLRHQGRAWFDWYVRATDRKPLKIEVDWATGKAVWSSGASVGRSARGTLTLHVSLRPLASLYLIFKHVLPETDASRTYSLSVVDGTLHWDFGKPGSGDEWHRNDPLNWMRGCRFILDDIFGRAEHSLEKVGPSVRAVACFPEGQYTLTLQRETRTWKRPRWPFPYVRKAVDITLEKPPGFQGKGENSYDCGPDAIYGMSSPGHSYEDAVAAYVKAVLQERAKRGHLAPEHRTLVGQTP
jgi:hypothetical protein